MAVSVAAASVVATSVVGALVPSVATVGRRVAVTRGTRVAVRVGRRVGVDVTVGVGVLVGVIEDPGVLVDSNMMAGVLVLDSSAVVVGRGVTVASNSGIISRASVARYPA